MIVENSINGSRGFFETIDSRRVTFYLCGPTTSDYSHLGHIRTYLSVDLMIRYLEYRGYKVEFVMNVTDFDDLIVSRAKENHEDPLAFSRRYERAFLEDMKAFHIRTASRYPRASDHVKEIIEMIEGLVQKRLTYESGGVVYFDAEKSRRLGVSRDGRIISLCNCFLWDLLSGLYSALHSICTVLVQALGNPPIVGKIADRLPTFLERMLDTCLDQRGPYDIVLWKSVSRDELGWESPWGWGRPGWHIECSVMSRKYLGPQIDFHGGGEDLKSSKYRHHQCEIALSESYTGKKPFVRNWVHVGLLKLNGRKMAKSINNFITAKDFLEKHDAESLRMLVLSRHRRQTIDFTEEALSQWAVITEKVHETRNALSELTRRSDDSEPKAQEDTVIVGETTRLKREFLAGMDNDFNSAIAISRFCELVQLGDRILTGGFSKKLAELALNTINELGTILGLFQHQKRQPISGYVTSPYSALADFGRIPIPA